MGQSSEVFGFSLMIDVGAYLLISSLKLEMSPAQEQLSLIIPRKNLITVVCKLFFAILV